jgi:hypothetical protein
MFNFLVGFIGLWTIDGFSACFFTLDSTLIVFQKLSTPCIGGSKGAANLTPDSSPSRQTI